MLALSKLPAVTVKVKYDAQIAGAFEEELARANARLTGGVDALPPAALAA